MKITLGIDVGTVSAKCALLGPADRMRELLEAGAVDDVFEYPDRQGEAVAVSAYRRVQGRPLDAVVALLREVAAPLDADELGAAAITGSAGKLVGEALGLPVENEFRAAATGIGRIYPDVENIFEMGGENSKFIRVSCEDGVAGIADYETNGDCAAGTGSFMDQQASRLRFAVEEVGDLVLATGRAPKIAGRCSVFAKSDMIHAQQKGYRPEEVLKGLCEAVARNFRSNIAKGKEVRGRTAFVGGVALNRGVAAAVREVFELGEDDFFVPREGVHIGAIGAAMIAAGNGDGFDAAAFLDLLRRDTASARQRFPSWLPLTRERVKFLRDRIRTYSFEGRPTPVDAFLGVDVGSVSTNLVLVDDDGEVIKEIYLRTQARPIEVVGAGLREIRGEIGDLVRIRGVGTTGSGRELIGELIGADTVNDEITAHKTGAAFIGDRLLGTKVDTIFEIGGQDSKYIRIDDGIVTDFTMNEACAAGTGSFLEEQAEKLDVSIIGEFAERAFSSGAPLRLGERCTVYMEQDVSAYLKRGADKDDIIAGLSYSVVQNYLNRVVRGRRIGRVVFFQGGTAYNDAVAAAFSEVLQTEIIVPPHNGVIGAVGSALLAREKVRALGLSTIFRGYDLDSIDYSIREFTCKGCTNYCDIQEFTVEGERTYWGDKCSDRYRKRAKVPRKPVIEDLVALYEGMLERDWLGEIRERTGRPALPKRAGPAPRVGVPRAMYYYDRHPFWKTYLEALGAEVVTSRKTNKEIVHRGLEAAVAEPCFPIQVANGHAVALLGEEDLDCILVPNVIDSETDIPEVNSYVCPWGQTLPFVLRAIPALRGREDFIAAPTVHFRDGERVVERELRGLSRRLGAGRRLHGEAVRAGFEAQRLFRAELVRAGAKALETLERAGEQGIVLIGRPYNVIDRGMNLDVPGKLRDSYGVNVIPHFFLDIGGIGIRDIDPNMFWNYGRRILQAARFAGQRENLHLLYITNFKCGPDSYIKHFTGEAAVRPLLTLQFDAHGNDAGVMTRCEAYLDSKGVLRWWKHAPTPSRDARSTFLECPPEEQRHSLRPSGTSG
ncbi:MAG: acyl-CoA dehydratase activase [Candidatus Krumholzibacteria bacterium]|nr:acyl-CoA dehydratase activase [Candidatus Krumholzibacteria bacterium]